jgi:hypothetical protein
MRKDETHLGDLPWYPSMDWRGKSTGNFAGGIPFKMVVFPLKMVVFPFDQPFITCFFPDNLWFGLSLRWKSCLEVNNPIRVARCEGCWKIHGIYCG